MEDGKAQAIPYGEYRRRLGQRLLEEAPTLEAFRARWIDPRRRKALLYSVVESGFSPALVRAVDGLGDYDLYDVLGRLAYSLEPHARRQRAEMFAVQHAGWLAYLPPRTARTLCAVAQQFARAGIDGLESTELFKVPMVAKAGGLPALRDAGNPADLIQETKARLLTN
jgi:type I restriction enzyme R subunit